MSRRLAMTLALVLAGVSPAIAQTHPPSHPQTRPHGPDHAPMDPAQHAALHAQMHGTWQGTWSVPGEKDSSVDLNVATDKAGTLLVEMSGGRSLHLGKALDPAIDGRSLRWTQPVSGAPCRASADLTAATPHAPEMMKVTFTCDRGDMTFALHRTKK